MENNQGVMEKVEDESRNIPWPKMIIPITIILLALLLLGWLGREPGAGDFPGLFCPISFMMFWANAIAAMIVWEKNKGCAALLVLFAISMVFFWLAYIAYVIGMM
ncbi:MAG: hypothetical protein Q7J68_03985 [Thermoplasmata archaeon]|nr:hypothetical protein [Thermoplasmata archaeon]